MKRLARLAAIPLLLLAAGRPAAGASARVSADVHAIDFGTLEPGRPPGAPSRVQLLVVSDGPWQLSIAVAPLSSSAGNAEALRLAWRQPGDRFRDLVARVPAPVATGPSTRGKSVPIVLDLAQAAPWELRPGRYAARLQLIMNGAPSSEAVDLGFLVPARVDLVFSGQPLDSPMINPIEAGSYSFARRLAVVTSNVPWRLTARLESPPRRRDGPTTLDRAVFRVACPPGAAVALAPSEAAAIARGEATGSTPRTLPVDVWLDLAGGELAGRYRSRLHFSAEPDGAR